MYDPSCLTTTKKVWLDIEETLLDNPTKEEAIECLKRVRHLMVQCIHEDGKTPSTEQPGPSAG